jgi:hypothetical protein
MFQRKSQRKVGDNPNIRTVMTFNKGGSWNLLNAPATDSRGQNTDCFATAGCSLHIHGTSDYWGPFYSLDSADGGLSWIEAAKGSHIYEFGDHGGIILMARDNVATQVLSYSWDHGKWPIILFLLLPLSQLSLSTLHQLPSATTTTVKINLF